MSAMLTIADVRAKIDHLAETNTLVKQLLLNSGPIHTWPKHLRDDAYRRMGIARFEDKETGIVYFENT